jgi:hypothetical protein
VISLKAGQGRTINILCLRVRGRLATKCLAAPKLLTRDEARRIAANIAELPGPDAWKLRTDAGPIDAVFINERGRLTIVECKLWKNSEAWGAEFPSRRQPLTTSAGSVTSQTTHTVRNRLSRAHSEIPKG